MKVILNKINSNLEEKLEVAQGKTHKAINLAEKFINTPNEGKLVIKWAGKAVSYDNNKPWSRKKAAYSMKAWVLSMEWRYVSC